ncbi:hypothetical protein JNUCC0626_49720 (plasmid) [Lentzea sp. JNUCC 0626]|uniref:hypothetical protein n=1 Tax=Lentzea sp. JNUCC 0626 TaxID=3367513 RepID=UPI003748B022
MPFALLVLIAVLALLIISALLAALFTLLIRHNPTLFGGPQSWKRAALISLALVGFIWLLMLINTLFVVLVALLLGV